VVVVASGAELAEEGITRAAAAAAFPRRVLRGSALETFARGARPFSETDTSRSPAPPDHSWRVEL
jgi:hypothetical protein